MMFCQYTEKNGIKYQIIGVSLQILRFFIIILVYAAVNCFHLLSILLCHNTFCHI